MAELAIVFLGMMLGSRSTTSTLTGRMIEGWIKVPQLLRCLSVVQPRWRVVQRSFD